MAEPTEARKGLVPEEITQAEEQVVALYPDVVAGATRPLRDEEPKPFEITDEGHLAWVLERMRELDADLAAKQRIADEQINRVQDWLARQQRQATWRRDWWARAVEAFARKQWEGSKEQARGKGRTISLPQGSVSLKMEPPKWEYDEAALLAWLKGHAPELVRLREEPDRAGLKKIATAVETGVAVVEESGEVIEGVRIVAQPEPAFHLRLAESEGEDA